MRTAGLLFAYVFGSLFALLVACSGCRPLGVTGRVDIYHHHDPMELKLKRDRHRHHNEGRINP